VWRYFSASRQKRSFGSRLGKIKSTALSKPVSGREAKEQVVEKLQAFARIQKVIYWAGGTPDTCKPKYNF
jgi:hypothetical protein